jgi:regulator of sigma E protease
MLTALIFIIVLAVLIFVHELGHFLTARWSGIRVDAFKIGFGPRILSWKRGETEYGVNLIPFGGYVKIHGENPDEESVSGPDASRSFVNKPRWKQVIVLVAGVVFNFIFAWLLYTGGFMSGVTATQDGFEKYSDRVTNQRIMITFVQDGSPADKAGLVVGDIIGNISNPVSMTSVVPKNGSDGSSIGEIQNFINDSSGETLQFAMKSDGDKIAFKKIVEVIPVSNIVEGKYAIGIAMQEVGDLKLPFFSAVWEGLHYTLVMIRETAIGLYSFIINIFQGTANFSDVAGPIGIAGIVGGAAKLGFTYLIMITALISINLGVINLIPFPALDGGRILFVLIEGVIRRRIPMKFTNWVNGIGFVLLMLLMVVITYKDIAKMFK